jgi:uncharacterized membrane protein YkgB
MEVVRANVLSEYRVGFEQADHLIELAIEEAEALAWQTGYPELVFPELAVEKARQVAATLARRRNYSKTSSAVPRGQIALRITDLGFQVLRYGLALVIGWIGIMKFTEYEAKGIQPLVEQSPFMSWMYHILSARQFSDAMGVVEIGVAILIALRPFSPKASAIGSAAAVLMFLSTLSFLFSTPGWEPSLGGFPALSALLGQFLLKDVVLLGTALWSLGEALSEVSVAANTMRTNRS